MKTANERPFTVDRDVDSSTVLTTRVLLDLRLSDQEYEGSCHCANHKGGHEVLLFHGEFPSDLEESNHCKLAKDEAICDDAHAEAESTDCSV